MKKIIGIKIILLWCFTESNVLAQCTVQIPAAAIVINADTSVGGFNKIFWVCSGDTLGGSGFDHIYFVEPGGALSLSGVNKKVYLKSGASINCSGIDDTIYYEAGAIISCSGIHVDILCFPLIFDYTYAPPNGCTATSIDELTKNYFISVYPNPANKQVTIKINNGLAHVTNISLADFLGRTLIKSVDVKKEQHVIDISELQAGIYLLNVITGNSLITRKIIKEE